jgi:hypothetical protein
MNNDKKYWIKEAYRHLELALIGAHNHKVREHIDLAIECLNEYCKEEKK